jgi:hypothetical protein
MFKLLAGLALVGIVAGVFFALAHSSRTEAADDGGTMVAHDVFFTLNDNSDAARKKLVDACKKYLSKHTGAVFFAAGTRAADFDRPVNDRDFDVSLHIYFQDKAAHDKYQDSERHQQFIAENKDNWKKVRVFDSLVGK